MSFSDQPREPRAPRRARPRLSLKMQAIGFLSRREHSRQELRAKLLDSLRRRAREEAALDAAAEKAAQELAEHWREQPSNGIDDAFASPVSTRAVAPVPARARETPASRARALADAPAAASVHATAAAPAVASSPTPAAARDAAPARAPLETLSLANGAPLPAPLRASLAAQQARAPGASAQPPWPPSPPSPPSPPNDAASTDGPTDDDLAHDDPEAAVDQLLDWLAANNYLSETRFVESRVNARSRQQGTLRIKLELSRHGLALEPEQATALRETEFARAQALWQRKFGEVAPDARLRAKQARFLAARGFAADVVRRVVGGEEEF